MVSRKRSIAAVVLALAGHVNAAEAPVVDLDFLEFLGTDDSDDEDWNALLTATPDEAGQQSSEDREPPAKTPPLDAKQDEPRRDEPKEGES